MIYPIVKFGDPVLEKPAATITEFDDELRKLVDDMFESMYAAHGVGLAAPQIGISKRIAVIDVTFKEDPEAKDRAGQSRRSFTPKAGRRPAKAASACRNFARRSRDR